ncbi:MAG: glycerol-3-phosphate acyltransferase [Chloroflexi bacterium]|nr:glycerol-3-phosphate acyltransferase [Chloroflexota bacterium]
MTPEAVTPELVLVLAAAYLMGSVPATSLIVRWYAGVDIRSVGSGNAGAMNVLDEIGLAPALLVAFVDIGKGAAAVGLAYQVGLGDGAAVTAGLLAVVGHDWSIFLRLGGGNGTSPAVGALLVLVPAATLAAMVLTFALWVTLRSRRLAGFVGLLSVTPIAFALNEHDPLQLGALLLVMLVFVKIGRFEGFSLARRPR